MPAASVTSMGSSPRAPQASANSLARASDTARKMFSYSFVASAASAELTRYTTSVSWLITRAALVRARAGGAADHPRGIPLQMVGVTGVDALGAEGHVHVGARRGGPWPPGAR